MSQSSGGFFYSIKAVVDKASFESGRQELAKLEQSGKRLIAGFTAAGAALVGAAKIAGNVAQSELKVATSIGASTDALAKWKTAANIAGASANGLIGAMAGIENKMQHLKTGTVDMSLAKNLGLMGIGYNDFADMDAEDRMKAVFSRADSMDDQRLAATLVGDILGQAGREYYDSLKLSGKTLDQQLKEAQSLNFMTEKNRKEAAAFANEFNAVKEAGKSIAQLIGSDIAAQLTPLVRKIKGYLITNRDAIVRGITGLAKGVGSVFNAVAGAVGKVAPFVEKLIDRFGGLDKVIIKLGVGFGTMKLMQFAGGLKSMISGLNLLKLALGGISKGLMAGGLFLVLEDLMYYFAGGESLIGRILPRIKEFSKELGFGDIDYKNLVQGLKDVGAELAKLTGNSFSTAIKLFSDLALIFKSLVSGDMDKLSENLKKFFNDWKQGLKDVFNLNEVEKAGKKAYEETLESGGSKVAATVNAIDQGARQIPILGSAYGALSDGVDWVYNKVTGKKAEDGIIQPDGRLINISPDDWVFAAKNVEDIASAFVPHGMTTNNSMSAPATYVINQSFTVNGGNATPQAVRAEAYRGTAAALQTNLKNAARIMQLMPGTR
ncbi:hypothetical protein [Treponema sp.]|uniref:hypothetical protein n=1 Tax=Treponema sp. TaxID=166 RepID=UPI003FD71085